MKKILLLSAILLGAVTASQAGIRFNIGLPLPPLPLPGIVIGHPGPAYCPPAAQVYGAPPAYYGYGAPCYDAPVVVAPPVYFGFGFRYGYRLWGRGYYGHCYYGHGFRGGH